jgi:hypothetical protein
MAADLDAQNPSSNACHRSMQWPWVASVRRIDGVPDQEKPGLDGSARPSLDEVLTVRDRQASETADVTPGQLAKPAPVPDDRSPSYAKGRRVRQCLGTVLNEEREHHGLCVRDLDKLPRRISQG